MNVDDRLREFLAKQPNIASNVWVASGAVIVGDVTIGESSSIWYNAVLRADFNSIKIGHHTNVQDNAVLHISDEFPCIVGDYVTIGHSARVHACTVGDGALIGMGSTVLDGASVGSQALIGANTLVPMGMKIPPGWLVMGVPARLIRELSQQEKELIFSYANKYAQAAQYYRNRRGVGQ